MVEVDGEDARERKQRGRKGFVEAVDKTHFSNKTKSKSDAKPSPPQSNNFSSFPSLKDPFTSTDREA